MNEAKEREYLLNLKSISDIVAFFETLIESGVAFEVRSGRHVIRRNTVDELFYLDYSHPVILKIDPKD